jgi:subtilisin family serine protease
MTAWWKHEYMEDCIDYVVKDNGHEVLSSQIDNILHGKVSYAQDTVRPDLERQLWRLSRYVSLFGVLEWARRQKKSPFDWSRLTVNIILDHALPLLDEREHIESTPDETELIGHVSRNRMANPAVNLSVPAIKGDAVRNLFSATGSGITWAILDSGIEAQHPAFRDHAGSEHHTRIDAMYDFTRVREILSIDTLLNARRRNQLARKFVAEWHDKQALRNQDPLSDEDTARDLLRRLARDVEQEQPVDWRFVAPLISCPMDQQPLTSHGTHVAGILGADWRRDIPNERMIGVCPGIRLYDLRVLAPTLEETEFAIMAALQFVRYLNQTNDFTVIHGVNLSLSIPHDVENYACGRTPICDECERLVGSGVVVVAAAGNRGYQRYETQDGTFASYTAFSITDPANADAVITVGSTHSYGLHTYGVSYFSSRGPTGDGRAKPDLVAPGERIYAPIPGKSYGSMDGTSMAAPHVSGAAALLMARYPEFIGYPVRIKKILCESATDLGRERSFQGHGMLDVLRAMQSV